MRLHQMLVGVVCIVLAGIATAGEGKQAPVCTKIHGALIARSPAKDWEVLKADAPAPLDRSMIALFGADFRSANRAVEARMIADVGQRGPFPVLESAARFHATKADLEVTLERGILVLTNVKASGSATVRVRITDEAVEVTLNAPKSKLAIELYGRHVAGPPNLKSVEDDAPVINVAFFALEGEVTLAAKEKTVRLSAPPGPALLLWDNLTRMVEVHRFGEMPGWAKPPTDDERKKFAQIAAYAESWAAAPAGIGKAIAKAIHSDDVAERRAAVVSLGAIDDEGRLIQVLNDKTKADARDMSVLALRHWLGRAPGQSIRLNARLQKDGYTATQAKNMIHLLNGIDKEKLRLPETYDLLIDALNHPKLPARELARWHLVRLVPAGKDIAFDAAAPEAMRLQSIEAWRKLIPEGKLPPPPKK